ncbi:methyltransferase [Bacterioplanes sanyensis]|uniref:class I SAM-dependent methyltransferase n=1 Tax=Bacterioplanes sanyensis TaxID=1249553 RepID=UPI0016764EA9|nr:50S ribosomal protein L11 methyltransferase [Bacterioplanes sanyensis]GGY44242.1 methyltransferase [Bacterioplanes sanyensis]
MEITQSNAWQALQQQLWLPGAELKLTPIPATDVQLALLTLADPQMQLDSQAIQAWWQNLPYWAFAWAGGQALARYLRQQSLHGKTVLDFGCGSGLAGIAAAKAGARVYVLDSDPQALVAAEVNAQLNQVEVMPLSSLQQAPNIDMVLAADVLYDISSNVDLRRWLQRVPSWLLAESEQIVGRYSQLPELQRLQQEIVSTLPVLGDFDQQLEICIYRCQVND